ncbi:MAG: TetR/AcrR family transcriptional regulator [Treponema sp.]|nr:TetR/AcrR family transcriptional regulator [Treponema sp.]
MADTDNMDKFKELPEEKQAAILTAALKSFAKHGYRKASMNDIAMAAHISKALLFHYFGTKKDLYAYLIEHCKRVILGGIDFDRIFAVDDFFERLRLGTELKIARLKKYPYVFQFAVSALSETDEEVKNEKNRLMWENDKNFLNALQPKHTAQFKKGVDISLVVRIISLVADGYAATAMSDENLDFDGLFDELNRIYDFFKKHLYKEGEEA